MKKIILAISLGFASVSAYAFDGGMASLDRDFSSANIPVKGSVDYVKYQEKASQKWITASVAQKNAMQSANHPNIAKELSNIEASVAKGIYCLNNPTF